MSNPPHPTTRGWEPRPGTPEILGLGAGGHRLEHFSVESVYRYPACIMGVSRASCPKNPRFSAFFPNFSPSCFSPSFSLSLSLSLPYFLRIPGSPGRRSTSMRRRSSPRPPSSLSPTSTPRRTSRTPEPGSARSSIASRACDACRARRRKCRFDEDEGEGDASPRAAVQNRTQNQTRTQCRDCRRLGIVCSFLVPTRPRGPKRR